jgi:hypothetical protein
MSKVLTTATAIITLGLASMECSHARPVDYRDENATFKSWGFVFQKEREPGG